MIGLLQRVNSASVSVEQQVIGEIDRGLLVLVGVQQSDTPSSAQRLLSKLLNYRVFPDFSGRMNLSLLEVGGGLLLVPQFTLAADTNRGRRPSFASAASPELGQAMFSCLVELARQLTLDVAIGQFAADMQVQLVNDGPVTFWLEVA